MKESICIKSDFLDYYDYLSSPNGLVYERKMSECKPRGSDLKFLKQLGLQTLEIKPVNMFSYIDKELVVYTDSNKHWGHGKKICSYDEAMSMYGSYPASKYISLDDTNGITIKALQIGSRRFNLIFQKEENKLEPGKLINITEASRSFNRNIRLPIYSIDYLQVGNQLIATDFNRVQQLSYLNIQSIITADNIIKEIYNTIIEYKV